MEYKQDDGTKLYGFSQQSLDRNTRWIKAFTILGYLFFILICYLVYLAIRFHIPTNLARIVGGCE